MEPSGRSVFPNDRSVYLFLGLEPELSQFGGVSGSGDPIDLWMIDDPAEFELDIPPEVARPLLEKAWPHKFRTGKVALRAHLKSGVEGPPDGMDLIIWEKFDKVKEAKAKRKSGELSGSTTENNELSEVFGKDPRGRVRGAGSHVTKKQMIHLGIAKAKEKSNKVDNEGINALKDEFKSYV
ncbi:hypothetical protein LguiB_027971 [Lonicera macranthoides]